MVTTAGVEVTEGRQLPIKDRYLLHYPSNRERTYYLAVTVLATVALYYQAYCGGTVALQILNFYGITIKFYLVASVIGLAFGAAATVLGGLADRVGRVNLVAYGLLTVGILVAFVEPHMPNKWFFSAIGALIGLVEGVVLVATPALMRDFSPRMGRATAMGFWALGPVLGSLAAAEVSSHTLDHLTPWQDQFMIAGIAGLAGGLLVVLTLRELHPSLRDQIMVSIRDRELIQARAKGIDIEASIRDPWSQMITPRIVTSAFGISFFLMFYYVLVAALVLFLETTYRFSGSKANGVANWAWLFNALGLIVLGLLSDRLRIRKPLMLIGGIGSLVTTTIFAFRAGDIHTSAQTMTVLLCIQGFVGSMVFAPWMAAFTETVEDRNPALMATGLAVWGGVLRIVVALTILLFPFVVPAVTPLVDYGPQVIQYSSQYAAELQTAEDIHPATLRAIAKNPTDIGALKDALSQIESAQHVSGAVALSKLEALSKAASKVTYLADHTPEVLKASKQDPSQWKHWFLITAIGQLIFLPFVFFMIGPWTPAAGRRRDEEQEKLLQPRSTSNRPGAILGRVFVDAGAYSSSMPQVRFNHMEMTLPRGSLTDELRGDLTAFYGGVFGWATKDVEIVGGRQFLMQPDDGQFILVAESSKPIAAPGYDHLGLLCSNREEVDAVLAECRAWQDKDDRLTLKEYEDLVTGNVIVHAFYVRYLLPLWFDVQVIERQDGSTPEKTWQYA